MITDFLTNFIYSNIIDLINLIPDVSFSDEILGSVITASQYISGLDYLLPIGTILAIVSLYLTIEGIILFVKLVNWTIRKIPSIS